MSFAHCIESIANAVDEVIEPLQSVIVELFEVLPDEVETQLETLGKVDVDSHSRHNERRIAENNHKVDKHVNIKVFIVEGRVEFLIASLVYQVLKKMEIADGPSIVNPHYCLKRFTFVLLLKY